jgi:hypothetical protein
MDFSYAESPQEQNGISFRAQSSPFLPLFSRLPPPISSSSIEKRFRFCDTCLVRADKLGLALVFLMAVTIGRPADQGTTRTIGETFPMEKGTRWVYEGDISWQAAGEGPKIHKKHLRWEMEVVENISRDRYTAAMLRGHPSDLTWYEEGRDRGCYILLAVDGKMFYLSDCPPNTSQRKPNLSEADIAALTKLDNLIFKLPLRQGDLFGNDPDRGRPDTMYAWHVEAVRPATMVRIPGDPVRRPKTEYVLAFRTLPDHQIATYVPGIGLTAFEYSHHGTVSEVHMKLAQFLPTSK